MPDRRAFLRQLAGLPLLGGSIALLGHPTAAAVPVTEALLRRYSDWLATEYGHALIELDKRAARPKHIAHTVEFRRQWCEDNRTLNPDPGSGRFDLLPWMPPSARAAVILSAAGVALSGERHV